MKLIYRFFVTLGVIFFLLLLGLAYFVIVDPYNLRPLIMSMYQKDSDSQEVVPQPNKNSADSSKDVQSEASPQATSEGGVVNENQAKALESVGIDPASIPNQFTPEQTKCFVGILGQARVDAIVAGDTPTPADFFKAKNCI